MGINTSRAQTRYNVTAKSGRGISYIVVHYTGGTGSAENNCIYFSGGNRGASADWFIDKDGSIWQFNADPSNYYSWHCGDGKGKYGITNSNSVGIEVVSNGEDFTQAQIDALRDLVSSCMSWYGVSASNVVRHYDASRKECPAPYVNSSKWAALKSYITGGKATYTPSSGGGSSSSKNYLAKGDSGSAVKELQQKLIAAGYSCGSCGADGIFGSGTDSAVRAFQRDHGLTVDGLAGNATMSALNGSKASSSTSSSFPLPSGHWYGKPNSDDRNHSGYYNSADRPAIKQIQAKVGSSADGYFGENTAAKVKSWQSGHGLTSDGLVGINTWSKMF